LVFLGVKLLLPQIKVVKMVNWYDGIFDEGGDGKCSIFCQLLRIHQRRALLS